MYSSVYFFLTGFIPSLALLPEPAWIAASILPFLLLLSTCAFWFVKMDNILVIFNTMFDGAGIWPITIYPGWMRVSLTFVIPVAFSITILAQSLTGRLTPGVAIGAVTLAVGFTVTARWFWRFGLKHYTGASA